MNRLLMQQSGGGRRDSLPEIKAEASTKPPRILLSRPAKDAPKLKKVTFNTRLESPRKKKKKTKMKLRLRLPKDPSSTIRNPFENNWIVDTPRDILRERTNLEGTMSPLQAQLIAFHEEVAYVGEEEYELAGKAARELMRLITRKLKKMEFSNGLTVLPPVFAGSTFDMSHSMEIGDIDILLCFELHAKAKVETLQAGYQIINLPRHKQKDGGPEDPWLFGRSEDGQYLSCHIVSWLFHGLIEKIIARMPNARLHPYTVHEGASQIMVTLNDQYTVHLIPATWDQQAEGFLVTRPYLYDENPFSDIMWRYCFTEDEHLMFNAMDRADRGKRKKVYQILRALIRLEHTLQGITAYHIKTVLFHMFDADVDHTPRWQRGDMELCFMNVLKELKHYFVQRNLPNFFLNAYNLLDNLPDRTWTTLKNRISYLASDPRECARILRKRSRYLVQLSGRVTDSVTSVQTI